MEGSDEVDGQYYSFFLGPTSSSSESYHSLSSKEWSGSESVGGAGKRILEILQGESSTDEDELELAAAATEVGFLPKDESAAESDERGKSKTAEVSEISVDNAIGMTQERSRVTEVAAEVLEVIPRRDREKAAESSGHGGNASQIAGGDETSPAPQVQQNAPLVVGSSKWWNCCGLLDFVSNPDG